MGIASTLVRSIFRPGAVAEVAGGVADVAGAFRPNATRQMELGHEAFAATQTAYAAEFARPPSGPFDSFVNGLNRLPRPVMALGTVGLFAYAMTDPSGFSLRMDALATVPEPLWWLLGAVVAFYFGARELHHTRTAPRAPAQPPAPAPSAAPAAPADNPALSALQDLDP